MCVVIQYLYFSERWLLFSTWALTQRHRQRVKECTLQLFHRASSHLQGKHLLAVWLCTWPVSTQLGVSLSRTKTIRENSEKSQVTVTENKTKRKSLTKHVSVSSLVKDLFRTRKTLWKKLIQALQMFYFFFFHFYLWWNKQRFFKSAKNCKRTVIFYTSIL